MDSVRYFYYFKCSIYRTQTEIVKGSEITTRTPIYENIDCSYWSTSHNVRNTNQAMDTVLNTYELNLKPGFENVRIGDEVEIEGIPEKFEIELINLHKTYKEKLDNIQIYLKIIK